MPARHGSAQRPGCGLQHEEPTRPRTGRCRTGRAHQSRLFSRWKQARPKGHEAPLSWPRPRRRHKNLVLGLVNFIRCIKGADFDSGAFPMRDNLNCLWRPKANARRRYRMADERRPAASARTSPQSIVLFVGRAKLWRQMVQWHSISITVSLSPPTAAWRPWTLP